MKFYFLKSEIKAVSKQLTRT